MPFFIFNDLAIVSNYYILSSDDGEHQYRWSRLHSPIILKGVLQVHIFFHMQMPLVTILPNQLVGLMSNIFTNQYQYTDSASGQVDLVVDLAARSMLLCSTLIQQKCHQILVAEDHTLLLLMVMLI